MPLIQLIYLSDAREGMVYRDFTTIMEQAAVSNRALGITGMLCHGSGQFLQVLEGERTAVSALYHHIVTDPRHTTCTLMLVEEVAARDFSEWSMRVVDWGDGRTPPPRPPSRTGLPEFAPRSMSGAGAARFLRDLARAERLLLE